MTPTRRRLFQLGATAAVAGMIPALGRAQQVSSEPRRISLHNLHTDESLDAVYWDNGRYVPDALAAVNHVLRDYRNGEQHFMRPELMDLITTLGRTVEHTGPVHVISGYRSPVTNAFMHTHSSGVASHSLHMQGMAMDIRMPGVQLSHLHNAALSLGRGGVGYYPSSDFVHVDVGAVRHWGADTHDS